MRERDREIERKAIYIPYALPLTDKYPSKNQKCLENLVKMHGAKKGRKIVGANAMHACIGAPAGIYAWMCLCSVCVCVDKRMESLVGGEKETSVHYSIHYDNNWVRA